MLSFDELSKQGTNSVHQTEKRRLPVHRVKCSTNSSYPCIQDLNEVGPKTRPWYIIFMHVQNLPDLSY